MKCESGRYLGYRRMKVIAAMTYQSLLPL